MSDRIADMGVGGTIVPNTAMMLSGGLRDTSRKPIDIKPLALHSVEVLDRERPVDKDKVAELAASIKRDGLLQPIGVRRSADGYGKLRLVYGAHRLAAAKLIAEEDPTQDAIAAIIFPASMPDWACKMAEIAENLYRKDLSPKQYAAQTTLLAGLEKKHGNVINAKAKGNYARSVGHSPKPNGLGLGETVTERVASLIGKSDETVRNRVRSAAKLAEREGVAFDGPQTPEKLTGDQLIAIGEAAAVTADKDRQEAVKTGKPDRSVNPAEPLKETQALARLDVIDPQPFIDWCRKRLSGKHKPMSLEMLLAYRVALDALIAEQEAKP